MLCILLVVVQQARGIYTQVTELSERSTLFRSPANWNLFFLLYWRAGASLPSRPNGAIFIYLYPALMYAVMFYVILNKRKLHFPLAKNVMHSPSNNNEGTKVQNPRRNRPFARKAKNVNENINCP